MTSRARKTYEENCAEQRRHMGLPVAPKTYSQKRAEQRRRMGLPVSNDAAAIRCDGQQFTLSHDALAKTVSGRPRA